MENVSDEELRTKLAEKGHVIGPIVSSTRILYQRIYLDIMKRGKFSYFYFFMLCSYLGHSGGTEL